MALNCQWGEPLDSSEESKQAAERWLQFRVSIQTYFCYYCKVEPYKPDVHVTAHRRHSER
jgi:hypothetical protein